MSGVTFLTALLPTVGAAIRAIQAQGDFKTVAEQSDHTAELLKALDAALEKEPLLLSRLADRLERLSHVMMADIHEWHTVFRTRPLSVPN